MESDSAKTRSQVTGFVGRFLGSWRLALGKLVIAISQELEVLRQ